MSIQPKPPTITGPDDWFTGDVWIDPIVQPDGESQLTSLDTGASQFFDHRDPEMVGWLNGRKETS